MSYFNYHAKAKKLIKEGHLTDFEFFDKWNKNENCLVLFFDSHKPMPIKNYKIEEYLNLINNLKK